MVIHEYGTFLSGMALGDQKLLRSGDSWEPAEPEASATLWRYMSLAKFCSLLDRKALFFSLIGDMEDRYEGFIYPPTPRAHRDSLLEAEEFGHDMLREIARTALVSCWTESVHGSSLMWKAYAGAEGVAIRTSFQNLKDSIRSVQELPVSFGRVEYVDYRNEVERYRLAPLLHKRMEYREEGEVRAILPGPPWDFPELGDVPQIPLDPDVAEQRGRYVPVDLGVLVKEVVLPPHATPWFAEVVKSVIHGSSVSPRLMRSAIELPPHESNNGDAG